MQHETKSKWINSQYKRTKRKCEKIWWERWILCSPSMKWPIRSGLRQRVRPQRWIGASRSGPWSDLWRSSPPHHHRLPWLRSRRLRQRYRHLCPFPRSSLPQQPPCLPWDLHLPRLEEKKPTTRSSTILIIRSRWIVRIRRLQLIPMSTACFFKVSSIWHAPSLLNGSLSFPLISVYIQNDKLWFL